MKQLTKLTEQDFIKMAKIIDNNFVGNQKIIVEPMKLGVVRVIGHADGGQCINCDVKFDVHMNNLNRVETQNEDPDVDGAYRKVTEYTLKRIKDYLNSNGFIY